MSKKWSLFYWFMYFLPKIFLSRVVGYCAQIPLPKATRKFIIGGFAKTVGANLSECSKNLHEYKTLQEFFSRSIKLSARPIDKIKNLIISPADATCTQAGVIRSSELIQAKGQKYNLKALLRHEGWAKIFAGGHFATLYLAPSDYHRFHVPMDSQIVATSAIAGSLWPVNSWGVENIPGLYTQNERMVSYMDIYGKKLALVAVGATMVGKILFSYTKLITRNGGNGVYYQAHEPSGAIQVSKGDELGRFMFGSSIIILFEAGLLSEFLIQPGQKLFFGKPLGLTVQ